MLNPLPILVKESGEMPVMKVLKIPFVGPTNDFTVDQKDLKVASAVVPSQVTLL
jgi:hypothetical protein